MNWNRILSSLLSIIYIFVALVSRGAEAACWALIFIIFPLACIWFSDAMGGFMGPAGAISVTKASPGIFVRALGWLLLVLPLLIGIIGKIAG